MESFGLPKTFELAFRVTFNMSLSSHIPNPRPRTEQTGRIKDINPPLCPNTSSPALVGKLTVQQCSTSDHDLISFPFPPQNSTPGNTSSREKKSPITVDARVAPITRPARIPKEKISD